MPFFFVRRPVCPLGPAQPLILESKQQMVRIGIRALMISTCELPIPDQRLPPAVAADHARLEVKCGRLFCTALAAADPDALLSPTFTWIEGHELRPGVAYMVSPGAALGVGDLGTQLLITEFTEGQGSSAMADMLMQGMASQASQEVQDQLKVRS